MNYRIFVFCAVLFFGCSDPSEDAPANFKKGNDFYAVKEYEIAEYYFEKIPEESPYFKKSQKRLREIESIKKLWGQPQATKQEVQAIVIVSHSFTKDNLGQFPAHQFTLVNNTDRKLKLVEIEFVYYDKSGTEDETAHESC